MWDVGQSEWVQFADLMPSEKPVVLWFWAPHCPACAREAPGMKAFAEENADVVDVVGVGTQDDAQMAADFVADHELPFRMLWDESFETWTEFGVSSQPAAILLSADGDIVDGWMGAIPEARVLELVEEGANPA